MRTELAPGLEISRIITGLWQIADLERTSGTLDANLAADQMKEYADQGMTTFDMADHYGSSECIAGQFSKLYGHTMASEHLTKWVPPPGALTRKQVRTAVERALDRMQTPALDLLQFHAWNYADASWLDGLYYLDELRQQGLIRHLGVTNFDAVHFEMALESGIPLVSNQVCHSVIDQRAVGKLASVCTEKDTKLLAFGTLAGGFLTDRWLGQPEPDAVELTTWSQMKYKRFIDVAGGWALFQDVLQSLRMIANKHQVSIANVACCYALQHPSVAGIIIGARLGRSEHIEENNKVLRLDLDYEDLNGIREVQSALAPIPGDCGDEYRKPPFLTASGDLSHHLESMPLPYDALPLNADRVQVFSGTPWEKSASYCRAQRVGERILVSGTTATHGDRLIGGCNPGSQTHFIIDKIEGAIQSLGGTLDDVIRTRIYIHRLEDWEPVARAHGDRFAGINPVNTLVQAQLIGEGYLVEMEAEAMVR